MAIDSLSLPPLPMLVGALVVAVVVLALAIAAVRRAAHGVELARFPLAAHHDVRLDVSGPVVLQGDGPHFTRRFRGLAFRLIERTTGQVVPTRRLWMRTSVAGFSRVRLALARFDLPRAGVFRLEIDGLDPAPSGDDCALVLGPPAGPGLPLAIVSCMVVGAAAVGVLVGIAWTVLGGDGRMVPMLAGAPGAAGTAVPAAGIAAPGADVPAAYAGRQLRADPAPSGPTRSLHWAGAGLTLTVPAGWQTRADGAELDLRNPSQPSAYLVGHVVTFPPPTTAAVLVRAVTDSTAGRVQSGLSAGFATVRWGGVDGLVTIETRDDGAAAMAVWSAYRPTPKGVANVTVLCGAEAETFARLEPVATAILASARFD